VVLAALLTVAGCATRPINPPITQVEPGTGYRLATRQAYFKEPETLVMLAFSAAEPARRLFLRRSRVSEPHGNRPRQRRKGPPDRIRRRHHRHIGGSFTALAYGLYGDKLFTEYEQRFLKRDVQGEIIARFFSPPTGHLWSSHWGRSEMAADLYDEILFNRATFATLASAGAR